MSDTLDIFERDELIYVFGISMSELIVGCFFDGVVNHVVMFFFCVCEFHMELWALGGAWFLLHKHFFFSFSVVFFLFHLVILLSFLHVPK